MSIQLVLLKSGEFKISFGTNSIIKLENKIPSNTNISRYEKSEGIIEDRATYIP